MKFKNVFWGLILILTGSLIIGRNLGLLYFDWYSFIKLWPVIFILWGISVLPLRNEFKVSLLVIILGGATWFVISPPKNIEQSGFEYIFDNLGHEPNWAFKGEQNFNIPFTDSTKSASLSMDAAAGSFILKDTTSNLLDLNQRGNGNYYKYLVEQKNNNAKIEISEKDHHVFFNHSHRKVTIKLNSVPVWDLNLDAGASAVNFDLSHFKVRNFNLNGGAGSFKITLGNLFPNTRLTLDAGASTITIRIPNSSGCDLELSSVLSNRNLTGFTKLGNGHFQTANFDAAKNKIHLNIDAAVSSFTIIRY